MKKKNQFYIPCDKQNYSHLFVKPSLHIQMLQTYRISSLLHRYCLCPCQWWPWPVAIGPHRLYNPWIEQDSHITPGLCNPDTIVQQPLSQLCSQSFSPDPYLQTNIFSPSKLIKNSILNQASIRNMLSLLKEKKWWSNYFWNMLKVIILEH